MDINKKAELKDDDLFDIAGGGSGGPVKANYPDWLNKIAAIVGSKIYGIYDSDGGHGVYLYMKETFGALGINVLMVPEEFRF